MVSLVSPLMSWCGLLRLNIRETRPQVGVRNFLLKRSRCLGARYLLMLGQEIGMLHPLLRCIPSSASCLRPYLMEGSSAVGIFKPVGGAVIFPCLYVLPGDVSLGYSTVAGHTSSSKVKQAPPTGLNIPTSEDPSIK